MLCRFSHTIHIYIYVDIYLEIYVVKLKLGYETLLHGHYGTPPCVMKLVWGAPSGH